jgi:hypothetical protein
VPSHIHHLNNRPSFELCGKQWEIGIYCDDCLQIYLHTPPPASTACSSEITVKVRFGLTISTGIANPETIITYGPTIATLKPGQKWSCSNAIKRDEFTQRLIDDTMAIKITMWWDLNAEWAPLQSAIFRDFARLFESGAGSDVVLCVAGKEFAVHRSIVSARSPVMRAMLDGRFKEGAVASKEPIKIEDVDANTMGQLLRFMYSDSIGSSPEDIAKYDRWSSLLIASDRFDVRDLFELAQTKLIELISRKNALDCLMLALKITAAIALKNTVVEFIKSNGISEEDLDRIDLDTAKELLRKMLPN